MIVRVREAADSTLMLWAVGRFAGSIVFAISILGLAPQALCFRPLRGLRRTLRSFKNLDEYPKSRRAHFVFLQSPIKQELPITNFF